MAGIAKLTTAFAELTCEIEPRDPFKKKTEISKGLVGVAQQIQMDEPFTSKIKGIYLGPFHTEYKKSLRIEIRSEED